MATLTKDKIDTACTNFKKVHKSGKQKFKKLDDWLEKESNIFCNEIKQKNYKYPRYSYGQIIKVNFGINIGTEFSHTHFAIVLNTDDTEHTDNLTVLPLTSKPGYKRVKLGNLIKNISSLVKYQNTTYGVIPQITTISKSRILYTNSKHIWNKATMDKININLKEYLNINWIQ